MLGQRCKDLPPTDKLEEVWERFLELSEVRAVGSLSAPFSCWPPQREQLRLQRQRHLGAAVLRSSRQQADSSSMRGRSTLRPNFASRVSTGV